MKYAYVNPANTADISVTDLDDRVLQDGIFAKLPAAPSGFRVWRPEPLWDMYEMVEDGTPAPGPAQYYTVASSYVYAGIVNESGTVTETKTYTQIPIDDLKTAKESELANYTDLVYGSAFSHEAGGTDFWVRNDFLSLTARNIYGSYLTMRGLDALFDAVDLAIATGGGTNAEVATWWTELSGRQITEPWWSRDVKVFLYYQSTLQLVRDTATAHQWRDLMESAGTFAWQIRNATDRVQDDIELYHGADDWASLAAIDVTDDATYNWPSHYTGPLPG